MDMHIAKVIQWDRDINQWSWLNLLGNVARLREIKTISPVIHRVQSVSIAQIVIEMRYLLGPKAIPVECYASIVGSTTTV